MKTWCFANGFRIWVKSLSEIFVGLGAVPVCAKTPRLCVRGKKRVEVWKKSDLGNELVCLQRSKFLENAISCILCSHAWEVVLSRGLPYMRVHFKRKWKLSSGLYRKGTEVIDVNMEYQQRSCTAGPNKPRTETQNCKTAVDAKDNVIRGPHSDSRAVA